MIALVEQLSHKVSVNQMTSIHKQFKFCETWIIFQYIYVYFTYAYTATSLCQVYQAKQPKET